MPWGPLLAAVAVTALVSVLAGLGAGALRSALAPVAAGAIAAGVALALDDAADALLAAVPVSARRRFAARALVALAPSAVAWVACVTVAGPAGEVGFGAAAALAGAAVAVVAVAGRTRPDLGGVVGAAIATGWAVSPHVVGSGALGALAAGWIRVPGAVIITAVVVTAIAKGGR